MDVVVHPPEKGEASYESFIAEKEAVLASLAERAKLVADTFNSIEGFTCNVVQGAMYAFPQVSFFTNLNLSNVRLVTFILSFAVASSRKSHR